MSILSKLKYLILASLIFLGLSSLGTSAISAPSSIQVTSGWNLLGNGNTDPVTVATAFGDSPITSIWKWNADSSTWSFYSPIMADGGAAYAVIKGYKSLVTINPGDGFWINASQPFVFPAFKGGVYYASNFQQGAAGQMALGWNLISVGESMPPNQFNSGLSSSAPSVGVIPQNLTSLWAWDNSKTNWYFYAPNLEAQGNNTLSNYILGKGYLDFASNNKFLGPGIGFWVNNPNSSTATTIIAKTTTTVQTSTTTTVVQSTTTTTFQKRNQTINFDQPASINVGGSVGLSATASSGLAVSFLSTTPGTCTVSGNNLTAIAAGNCFITASQAGNGTFLAALNINQSFTVNLVSQAITFAQPDPINVGKTSELTATASSNLTVAFTSTTTEICTVSANTLTAKAAGTCSITAYQVGNGTYSIAPNVTRLIITSLNSQSINFNQIANQTAGNTSSLSASATSGLPVTFTSTTPDVCTVSGSNLVSIASGTCSITASQSGDGIYLPATNLNQSVVVSLASQNIATFKQPESLVVGSNAILSASTTSGLPVSFSTSTPTVCGVSGNTLSFISKGDCSITANQSGNNVYAPITNGTRVFNVQLAPQTITFIQLGDQVADSIIPLSASASSGLPVKFSKNDGSCYIFSENNIRITEAGTCTITASQDGNSTYGATSVTQSFNVIRASQVINFPNPGPQLAGVQTRLTASAKADGVDYRSLTPNVCGATSGSDAFLYTITTGTCTIQASQQGNYTFTTAKSVEVSFNVSNVFVTTFAGSGELGSSDGQATLASFGDLYSPVIDSAANVYVADSTNNKIRKITPEGLVSTYADGLNNPTGIVLDKSGNLYVADRGSHRIRRVAPNGVVSTFAGSGDIGSADGTGVSASFYNPTSLAIDDDANIYVTDQSNNKIRKITSAGVVSTYAGDGLAESLDGTINKNRYDPWGVTPIARFNTPFGIAVDKTGNVFVTEPSSFKIRKIHISGQVSSSAALPKTSVYGIASNIDDSLYVVAGGGVSKVSSKVEIGQSILGKNGWLAEGDVEGAPAIFSSPNGIAIDANGNLYVSGPKQVRKISFTGIKKQTINFEDPLNLTAGLSVDLFATATSGLEVKFKSITTNECKVNRNTLTLLRAGVCTIIASRVGNSIYDEALNVTNSFRVAYAIQTLTFNQPAAKNIGTTEELIATSSSGRPIYFEATPTNVCTVRNGVLTAISAGTCTVTANLPGDYYFFNAAPSVTQSFSINRLSQMISFEKPSEQTPLTSQVILASASSRLPVILNSLTPEICTVNSNTLAVSSIAAGICSIKANQTGNEIYSAAAEVIQSFSVNLVNQTITFEQPSAQKAGTVTDLVATSSSGAFGVIVSFASMSLNVCSVAGNKLTAIAGGTCIITASQSGTARYAAASNVTKSFTVLALQSITFTKLLDQIVGSTATLSATSTSGLEITFYSQNTNCTVLGNVVTSVASGSCFISAIQAGNSTYAEADWAYSSFFVNRVSQQISFPTETSLFVGDTTTLLATSTSGLSVTFKTLTPSICSIAGNTLTTLTAGTCTVQAEQVGTSNYFLPASNVTQSFAVNKRAQQVYLSFNQTAYVGYTYSLIAESTSGLPLTWTTSNWRICDVTHGNFIDLIPNSPGTCVVTARQSGNNVYSPASSLISFQVYP